jgi:hypothetical protein
MGKKHDRTLAAIFARPIRANIAWEDVVTLVEHLGGVVHWPGRLDARIRPERRPSHLPRAAPRQ